jgi:ABC-type phosphate/phosphonate transport system substrate-binding protein
VCRGAPLYRSFLITRSIDGPKDAEELRGGVHAFSDPESNSGHLVTRAWLAARGETPGSFFAKFLFTYGHRNVIRAVAAGLARSGSVDSYVWEVMQETEPHLVEATHVVWRSLPMGFPPIAYPRGADAGMIRALRSALVDMPSSSIGKDVLATLRLDRFSLEEPELFDSIAADWRRVGGQDDRAMGAFALAAVGEGATPAHTSYGDRRSRYCKGRSLSSHSDATGSSARAGVVHSLRGSRRRCNRL